MEWQSIGYMKNTNNKAQIQFSSTCKHSDWEGVNWVTVGQEKMTQSISKENILLWAGSNPVLTLGI